MRNNKIANQESRGVNVAKYSKAVGRLRGTTEISDHKFKVSLAGIDVCFPSAVVTCMDGISGQMESLIYYKFFSCHIRTEICNGKELLLNFEGKMRNKDQ